MSNTFDYVGVTDAARAVGVTVGRIRQLIANNTIKAEKVNNWAYAIPRSELKKIAKPAAVGRPRSGKPQKKSG